MNKDTEIILISVLVHENAVIFIVILVLAHESSMLFFLELLNLELYIETKINMYHFFFLK